MDYEKLLITISSFSFPAPLSPLRPEQVTTKQPHGSQHPHSSIKHLSIISIEITYLKQQKKRALHFIGIKVIEEGLTARLKQLHLLAHELTGKVINRLGGG